MPKTDTDLADLTAAIADIVNLEAVRSFDGHLAVDDVNFTKGTISGRVTHAHDDSTVTNFALAVAVS